MPTQGYVVEVVIPERKCPRTVKNRERLIKDGIATVYLSNRTSARDAESGFTRYGVSGGNNVLIFTEKTYEKYKHEIEEFLNSRFDSDWKIKLTKTSPVK